MLVASDDADRADQILAQALDAARAVGDTTTELRILQNMASSRYDVGDLDGAARLAATGVERARATGLTNTTHGLDLAGYAALVAYVRGDLTPVQVPERADDDGGFLDLIVLYAATARGESDVVERCRRLEPLWSRDTAIAHVAGGCGADALAWRGRFDESVELVDRVIAHLEKAWLPLFFAGIWLSSIALAALADAAQEDRVRGRDPGARVAAGERFATRIEQTAQRPLPPGRKVGPEGLAWTARGRAEHARLLGSPPGTVELWRAAVDAFGYGYRYEEARSRWRLAESLLLSGDRDEAALEAARALADAEDMGAVPLATAIRELARRGRLALPGARTAGSDVLTAREAEVLELVAQGLSNNQIGRRLFISGKTVSVHVSNVLAKLEVSGRAEAVDVAHRRGLIGSR
ncbi:helix-turn-helix transcriptional regulator [Cellulomonas gelida]|uniref:helix-turn-helix transcriptional regulator n=3 Tax=Cellulomonas TaxID=1707 RepID=UPI0035307A25